MITIYGRNTSANVQPVAWCAAELGLAFERLDFGGTFGKTDTPEYRAMNPNGLVPAIRDGDLTMFESAAIIRYLGARYGDNTFWPTDPATRGALDQWAEWIRTSFYNPLIPGQFIQLYRTPAASRDMAAVAKNTAALKTLSAMLDARIGDGPFLGGDVLCFADILAGHLLYRYFTLPFERATTPNLEAYYQRLTERPAYAEHVMVSYEGLKHPEA
jgi:glutathione S-transferase